MLVLSRHRDEVIRLGDDIKLTVVDIRGDKVRIGIEAPKNVSIHREEVYDAIKREGAKTTAHLPPVFDVPRYEPTEPAEPGNS